MTYRPTAGQRAAATVLADWAENRFPDMTTGELRDLARDVDRAIRHATKVVPRRHDGLTTKTGATADDARRIAARLEQRPAPTCRCDDPRVWLTGDATCPAHP